MIAFKMSALFCILLSTLLSVTAQLHTYPNDTSIDLPFGGSAAPSLTTPSTVALPTTLPVSIATECIDLAFPNTTDILALLFNLSTEPEIKVTQVELASQEMDTVGASDVIRGLLGHIGSQLLEVAFSPIPLITSKVSAVNNIIANNMDILQSRIIPLTAENSSLKSQISHKSAMLVSQANQIEKLQALLHQKDAQLEVEAQNLVKAKQDVWNSWSGQAELAMYRSEDGYWHWWFKTALAWIGLMAVVLVCNWCFNGRTRRWVNWLVLSGNYYVVSSVEWCKVQEDLAQTKEHLSAAKLRESSLQADLDTFSPATATSTLESQKLKHEITQLKAKVEKCQAESKQHKMSNEQLKVVIGNLESEVKTLERQSSATFAQGQSTLIAQLQSQLDNLTIQHADFQQSAITARNNQFGLQARLEKSQQTCTTASRQVIESSARATQQATIISSLEKQVKELSAQLAHQTISRTASTHLRMSQNTVEATASKIISFTEQKRQINLDFASQLVGAVETTVSQACGIDTTVSCDECKTALFDLSERLSAEKSSMQKMSTLVNLKPSPSFLSCRASAIESINHFESIVTKLSTLIAPIQSARAASESKTASTQAECQSLKAELGKTQQETTQRISNLQKKLAHESSQAAMLPSLQSRLALLVTEKSELHQEGTALQNQLASLRREGQQQLAENQKRTANLQYDVAQLGQQIAQLSQEQSHVAEFGSLYNGFVKVFAPVILSHKNESKPIKTDVFQPLLSDIAQLSLKYSSGESFRGGNLKELESMVKATRTHAEHINSTRRAGRKQGR